VENGVEAVIGGLTDDHAHATRPGNHAVRRGPTPQPVFPERLRRDLSRKNEVSLLFDFRNVPSHWLFNVPRQSL
jgi:hypothetical protein